jgi:hypothetical protein
MLDHPRAYWYKIIVLGIINYCLSDIRRGIKIGVGTFTVKSSVAVVKRKTKGSVFSHAGNRIGQFDGYRINFIGKEYAQKIKKYNGVQGCCT